MKISAISLSWPAWAGPKENGIGEAERERTETLRTQKDGQNEGQNETMTEEKGKTQ
jgi:hypothetical protein